MNDSDKGPEDGQPEGKFADFQKFATSVWPIISGVALALYVLGSSAFGVWGGINSKLSGISDQQTKLSQELKDNVAVMHNDLIQQKQAEASAKDLLETRLRDYEVRLANLEAYRDANSKRLDASDMAITRLTEQITALQTGINDIKSLVQSTMIPSVKMRR